MPDDVQLELQESRQKIEALERRIKLLEEGLHQAERLRQMFDRTAQELKATKSLLMQQSAELEEKVQERTKQLLAAQEELVRKEKLAVLGQVADTVGHELRNPLGVLNNAVYFLQTVLADSDEVVKEYLGIIKDEIADAERIVSDLLDAVRTVPPRPETTAVDELIRQSLRKCKVPADVTVRLEIPPDISPVLVDPAQMLQALRNLIENGMEAMPDGGLLEIVANENLTAKTVTVSIHDHGSGIAPEYQALLFHPMFTTKTRRIGLGLVVVKNLTQANGGSVVFESKPGLGSIFTVSLPSNGWIGNSEIGEKLGCKLQDDIPLTKKMGTGNEDSGC